MLERAQASSGDHSGDVLSGSPNSGSMEPALPVDVANGNYFKMVPHLNELRELAHGAVGPSACDLVKMLNREALQAGFEPVGANNQGLSTADFFQANAKFQTMETQLADKIVPENVSEVFELIKASSNYKPTGKVLAVIEQTYQLLIAGRQRAI